jgi:hypothetical protein
VVPVFLASSFCSVSGVQRRSVKIEDIGGSGDRTAVAFWGPIREFR